MFFERYFSDAAQEKKEFEFMNLRQEDMSVDDYQAKFESLSRFAPLLVSDEKKKVRRFQKGLKLPIRKMLIPLGLDKFAKALATAQMIEREMEEIRQEAEYQQGRGRSVVTHAKPRRDDPKGKRHVPESRKPYQANCKTCGYNHGDRPCYLRNPGACYKCGEQGHIGRNCPKGQPDSHLHHRMHRRIVLLKEVMLDLEFKGEPTRSQRMKLRMLQL